MPSPSALVRSALVPSALALSAVLALTASCARREPAQGPGGTQGSAADARPAAAVHTFHSDYFVFVSADAGAPLVVPVDLNWEWSDPSAVTYELKAWRGTEAGPWPMFYVKETRPSRGAPPATWPALEGTGAIQLAKDGSSITVVRPEDLGRIVLAVPTSPPGAVAREPYDGGAIETRAARTTAEVDGQPRAGWLIHEHIATSGAHGDDEAAEARRFGHFHWVPVLGRGGAELYLLRAMGDGSTRATWWTGEGGALTAKVVTGGLLLQETETVREATSGRAAVPRAWHLEVPAWSASFELHAVTAHTGHGDPKPHGRALYSQILVEGTGPGGGPTHGMVELILAD